MLGRTSAAEQRLLKLAEAGHDDFLSSKSTRISLATRL